MLHWICSFWGAGQAWPRSKHTGSLLPNTLRGKSPCLGAESATGRPEDLYSGAVSEAFGGVVVLVFGPLQQQSYAMSVCKNANWTGLTLSMPPTCRCQAKMASQASLDFQSSMIPCDSIFPLVVASNPVSTKNASQHTMWQLLFLTSQFVNFSNTSCQPLLVRFWLGMLHWICSFGGQDKHGHAANTQGACSQIRCGESPRALGQKVPLGDQKTFTLEPSAKLLVELWFWCLVLCSSKVMPWAFARTPTERGSLFPCPPRGDVLARLIEFSIQHVNSFLDFLMFPWLLNCGNGNMLGWRISNQICSFFSTWSPAVDDTWRAFLGQASTELGSQQKMLAADSPCDLQHQMRRVCNICFCEIVSEMILHKQFNTRIYICVTRSNVCITSSRLIEAIHFVYCTLVVVLVASEPKISSSIPLTLPKKATCAVVKTHSIINRRWYDEDHTPFST